MGRITRILSAIALITAACIWSVSTLVTKAAVVHQGVATLAERFPSADEIFRPADFIRATDTVAPGPIVATSMPAWGKTDRLLSMAGCGKPEWPFLAAECFPVQPARMAEPTVTIERRVGGDTSELVRVPVAPGPGAALAPACKQNLAAATARLERALAHLKGVKASDGAETCAAYRRDFFEMVKAREVTARCRIGPERDRELGTIDVAVENINGAIAQSCGS
jgi:hypothetical protein